MVYVNVELCDEIECHEHIQIEYRDKGSIGYVDFGSHKETDVKAFQALVFHFHGCVHKQTTKQNNINCFRPKEKLNRIMY